MAENNDTNNKITVYQRLNQVLNLDGFGFDTMNSSNANPTFASHYDTARAKIIIKGDSPQDIHRKGLELQQKQELTNKFFKSSERSFQKSMQYEAARLPAYIDYEGMEYYPIIASALDLFMEEATTIGINGKMLNIYSNKERIKLHLEELFNDIMNVNVNLPFWTRNVAKYGDNFLLLFGENKKGITNVQQMVNYEVERIERIHDGKPNIKFKERITGNDFNIFEIAHFRLLGDDKFIPYGCSTLSKVRRCFRQLVMSEDAMLTYRIIRAGEKKVFKIDVGNIDNDDVDEYIAKVASAFKKSPQVDANNGQIDYRFNILGNDEDYFLPVRNGNSGTGIDTLPGAQNLSEMDDIEYLRYILFIGLGIPKPFLSFQDAAGAGKNMAQFDMRFAKKIARIQQAMIQELNKIAIIHLTYLGFSNEDLGDFTLTLNNPSTQQELLKTDLLNQKAQAYSNLTKVDNGIAAMSHTEAKKLLFNMSDHEIINDLRQQRMERAVMQELQDTPLIIKNSTIFDDIDKKYGEAGGEMIGGMPETSGGTETTSQTSAPSEIGGGGATPTTPQIPGREFQKPSELPPVEGEGFRHKKSIMSEKTYNSILDKLVYNDSSNNKTKKVIQNKRVLEENELRNKKLNEEASDMISEINEMLKDPEKSKESLKRFDNIKFDFDKIRINETKDNEEK